ncbi:MAG: sigma-70 family RNA polymerase sigma factor [Planctomycetota bacterium]|nr:MAG: sigma-70 family RNA polymerase sigma factor [Planctomycetota bacterium]
MSPRLPKERVAQLVQAAQAGDRESFAALVEAHARTLLAFFALRGADPDAAQDGVQETFLRAYRSLATYDGRSPFASWLYGIARNVHLQAQRQQVRHAHTALAPSDAARDADPAARSEEEERRAQVRAALAELPERMRLVLQLRFVERRSCADIAEALGTTVTAVSPLIFRAKAALRKRLERKLGADSS